MQWQWVISTGAGQFWNNLNVCNSDHPLLLHIPLPKALQHKLPGPVSESQRKHVEREEGLCHGTKAYHLGAIQGGERCFAHFRPSALRREIGLGECWKLQRSGHYWPVSGGEEALVKEPLSHHSLHLEQWPRSQRPAWPRLKKMSRSDQEDWNWGAEGRTWARSSRFWAIEILFYYNSCGLTRPLSKDKSQILPSKNVTIWNVLQEQWWAAPGRKLDPVDGRSISGEGWILPLSSWRGLWAAELHSCSLCFENMNIFKGDLRNT